MKIGLIQNKTGAQLILGSRFSFLVGAWVATSLMGCSSLTLRPVQLMSDTSAAIKAAREVKADTLAPELFRQSSEWYVKSRKEYQLKNYATCEQYAKKAKFFAEQAEFEAIKNGATRVEFFAPDPLADTAHAPSKKPADANKSSGPVYGPEGGMPSFTPAGPSGGGGMQQMDPFGGIGGGGMNSGMTDPMMGGGGMTDPMMGGDNTGMDPMGGGGMTDPMMDPTQGTDSNMGGGM